MSANDKRNQRHEREGVVEPEEHTSFFEARHLQESIYKAMIMDLYKEGCEKTAHHFTCLVLKEQELVRKHLVTVQLKEKPLLLHKLCENVRLAAKSATLPHCGAKAAWLEMLHQTLMLLQEYEENFDWLLSDLYSLFVGIAEQQNENDGSCDEIKSHIFCSFAHHLAKKGKLNESMEYFGKSLELCRGKTWTVSRYTNCKDGKTMHEFVVVQFAHELIGYAKTSVQTDPALSTSLVQQALATIAEVDESRNYLLLSETYMFKTTLLMEQKLFEEAIFNSRLAVEYVDMTEGVDYMWLTCKLNLQMGICLQNLNVCSTAFIHFKQVLLISTKYNLEEFKGLALLHLSKLYSQHSEGKLQAIYAYDLAKRIFDKLLDKRNKQRAFYGSACLMVKEIYSDLLKVFLDTHQAGGNTSDAQEAEGEEQELQEVEETQEDDEREYEKRLASFLDGTHDDMFLLDDDLCTDEDGFQMEANDWTDIESDSQSQTSYMEDLNRLLNED